MTMQRDQCWPRYYGSVPDGLEFVTELWPDWTIEDIEVFVLSHTWGNTFYLNADEIDASAQDAGRSVRG